MHLPLSSTAAASPDARPGLTSLIRTGRGLMTLQTELVGQPTRLETIVDFRGRVLKTWHSPFHIDPQSPDGPGQIRAWHAKIEERLRAQLSAVAKRRSPGGEPGPVVAELFIAAMRSYAERERSTALALLEICEYLQPGEARVRAAIERARSSLARSSRRG